MWQAFLRLCGHRGTGEGSNVAGRVRPTCTLFASAFRAGRRYTPMNAVQISGMSGAGKTTIAAVLARRGLAVIDADGDPLLARHVDSAGNVVGDPIALLRCSCWRSTSPQCWDGWQAGTRNGAVSGTHASTSAASCRNIRAACAHPGRFPSTPGGLWTRWWTRYSLTRWVAPPRAEPESRAISPAGTRDPRTVKRFLPQGHCIGIFVRLHLMRDTPAVFR
jgi:hypothetical protein